MSNLLNRIKKLEVVNELGRLSFSEFIRRLEADEEIPVSNVPGRISFKDYIEQIDREPLVEMPSDEWLGKPVIIQFSKSESTQTSHPVISRKHRERKAREIHDPIPESEIEPENLSPEEALAAWRKRQLKRTEGARI